MRLQVIYRCTLALILLISSAVCLATDDMPEEDVSDISVSAGKIEFNDGLLSVTAEGVSLIALMQEVAAAADFEVSGYGNLSGHTGSWTFSDMPLAKAIVKLLRDTNSIVTYRSGNNEEEGAEITRIYLLGSSSDTASPIRIQTVEPGLDGQMRLDQAVEGDVETRLAAIERTEGLADEITLQDLAFALKHDPDPEVRIKAINALESIGGEAAVTALETGIGDQDVAVRKQLMQTFANLDDERIPLWIGQVLMSDPAPEVRLEAVKAVGRKEGNIAKSFLEAATEDRSTMVSEAALRLSR
jgi:hypothetical protein